MRSHTVFMGVFDAADESKSVILLIVEAVDNTSGDITVTSQLSLLFVFVDTSRPLISTYQLVYVLSAVNFSINVYVASSLTFCALKI